MLENEGMGGIFYKNGKTMLKKSKTSVDKTVDPRNLKNIYGLHKNQNFPSHENYGKQILIYELSFQSKSRKS